MKLTQSEKRNIGLTEIAKRIKQQIKAEFPNCDFSVQGSHSGGNSLHVTLMKSDIKVIKDSKEISELAVFRFTTNANRTLEELKNLQEKKHHQLNEYVLKDDYDPDEWCNGVFLTERGHNMLRRVAEIANQYNYDNSDPQFDHFDVNFYLYLNLGKWDKPFVDGEGRTGPSIDN